MSYASFYERRSSSSVLVVGPQQQQHRCRRPHQPQQQRLRARSVVEVHRRRRQSSSNQSGITRFSSPTTSRSALSSSPSLSDDTVVVISHPDYNLYFEANLSQSPPSPNNFRDYHHYGQNCYSDRVNHNFANPFIRHKSPTFPLSNNYEPPTKLASSFVLPITLDHRQQSEKELAAESDLKTHNNHEKDVLLVKCDYEGEFDHELSIRTGETLRLIDDSSDWWMVENERREIGFVPSRCFAKANSDKFEQLSNKMGLLYSIKKRLRSISASSQPSTSAQNGCTALASVAGGGGNGGLLPPGAPFHYGTGTGGQKCSDDFERPPVWSPPRRMNSSVNNSNHPVYQHQIADTSSSSVAGSSSLSPPIILRSNGNNNNMADSDENNVLAEAIALFDYRAKRPDELALNKNDKISVLEKNDDGWWRGINRTATTANGNGNREGWFPSNFVRELYYSKYSPTKQQQRPNGDALNNAASKQSQSASTEAKNIPANNGVIEEPTLSEVALPYCAMYSFKASNDDELSFERHEILTIIDHPACGHNWFRAFNADGHGGLVPRNFIEPLSRVHTPEKMIVMLPTTEQQQQQQTSGKAIKIKNTSKASSSASSVGAHNLAENSKQPPVTKTDRNIAKPFSDDPTGSGEPLTGGNAAKSNPVEATNGEAAHNIMSLPHKDNHSMSRRSSGGAMPTFINHDALKQRAWYYGRITRAECDDMLNRFGAVGEFLVRDSETGSAGDFAISLRAVPRNKHFKVQCDVAKQVLCIGSRQFASLDAIIEHYQQTPICTLQSGDKLHLKTPLKAPR